jgi:hypothetical protein
MREGDGTMTSVRAGRFVGWAVVMAAAAMTALAAAAVAAPRTRSCGYTPPLGYPIGVKATANVTCRRARQVIDVAYSVDGKPNQCTAGNGRYRACTVQGYRCRFRGNGPEFGRVTCTKGRRRLIVGGNM